MAKNSMDQEKKRDEILEAACELFARFGFKKTTLEDIGDEVRLGKASLYYYFRSKDEIFSAVINRESETLLEVLEKAVAGSETGIEKIGAFIRTRYEHIRKLKTLYRITSSMVREVLPLAQEARANYLKKELQMMTDMLQNGIADGELELEQPEIVALVIMAGLKGLDETFISYGRDEDISQGLDVLLKILGRGMLHPSK